MHSIHRDQHVQDSFKKCFETTTELEAKIKEKEEKLSCV